MSAIFTLEKSVLKLQRSAEAWSQLDVLLFQNMTYFTFHQWKCS